MGQKLTAIIEKKGNGYVALCPELDIASQGDTVEQARDNLKEVLELFYETASKDEIESRLLDEIKIGTLQSIIRQSSIPRTELES